MRGGLIHSIADLPVAKLPDASMPVLLDARGPEARKPVFVDRCLPGEELLGGQLITLAGFLKAEQTAAHGRHHLRFPPDDPAAGVGWRQIRYGKRAAIWPYDVLDAWPNEIGHPYSLQKSKNQSSDTLLPQL
jgi:hypothetical protein